MEKAADISKAACSTDAFRAETDRVLAEETAKVEKVVIHLFLVDIYSTAIVLIFSCC